jgi:hypothetical protein
VQIPFFGTTFIFAVAGGIATAAPPNIEAYLQSMDTTEVTFSGHIKYDERSLNDIPFTFYTADGNPFPVTVDAGRKTRERIEADCKNSSFMSSLKDFCKVEGIGTVEIRGSRIHLSIDEVTMLQKP